MPRDIFRLAYSVNMSAEADTAELMLYGEIIEDMPENWKWSKEDKSAADFDRAIKDIRKQGAKKLLLRINSPGGVCTQSVAMRSILSSAGFDEINIRIEGLCASAATDIATIPGAHVAIAEGSEYMIHNPWCMAMGSANDLETVVNRLRNIEEMSRGFYAKRTGQSDEQIKQWMDAETWFSAKEAVEYGFADEIIEADTTATPAAACVTRRESAVMRALYRATPEDIALRDESAEEDARENAGESGEKGIEAPKDTVSNGEAGSETPTPSEINGTGEESGMDIKELSVETLGAENPQLIAQIQQSAIEAERARISDIEALTLPGYEAMADEAKRSGMSAMDFQKSIVSAMKKKGADFMQARKEETAPAQQVSGDAPIERTEAQEIDENAKAVAQLAKLYSNGGGMGMF